MKKINAFIIVLIASMLLPSTIFASEKNNDDPDKALEEILDLEISQVLEPYAERVIDERFETEKEKLEKYKELIEIEDPLVKYKVLEKDPVSNDKIVYTVETEYESGFIYEEKITLVKSEGVWYRHVTDKFLDEGVDFKLIHNIYDFKKTNEKNNKSEPNFGIKFSDTIEHDVGTMFGQFLTSFSGNVNGVRNYQHFYIPGPAVILDLSRQTLNSGYSMTYHLYAYNRGGYTQVAYKAVQNNVTNGYKTSFNANVSGRTEVYLAVRGYGYSRGGLYY